ncbi:MAG: DUF1127 domain-containing protein [Pseudomonadota bacterium]
MAYAANSVSVARPLGALFSVKKFFESLFLSMSVAASYDTRLNEIERLQRLSDEALASMDLKRDEIVRHVYRDLFYV